MDRLVDGVRLLCLGLLAFAGVVAPAQTTLYRCTSDGRTSLSDRPCSNDGGRPSTTLGAIGPQRDLRQSSTSYLGSVPKASEYLAYLSPLCAELNEGMRLGASRGLGPAARNELQDNYRRQCSEDEHNARKRLAEESDKKREARNNEAQAEKMARDRQTISREQCDEMYRIAHRRRQQLAAMNDGERADFERFEANWKARCQPG